MNIYVGKLSYHTSEEELHDMFQAYGQVDSAKIIMDNMSGRSKGFGFVEMPNDAEGQRAIEALDNTRQGAMTIIVNEARPKSDADRYASSRPARGRY